MGMAKCPGDYRWGCSPHCLVALPFFQGSVIKLQSQISVTCDHHCLPVCDCTINGAFFQTVLTKRLDFLMAELVSFAEDGYKLCYDLPDINYACILHTHVLLSQISAIIAHIEQYQWCCLVNSHCWLLMAQIRGRKQVQGVKATKAAFGALGI